MRTLHQLDVNNAVLHGDLVEEVYMKLSPSFTPQKPGQVQALSDSSLFLKGEGDNFVALLVYVDDVVIASPNQVQPIKRHLDNVFHIKDLGFLRFFLGLEIAKNSSGISMTQRKYALELLEETIFTDCTDCKPAKTPMATSARFSKDIGEKLEDIVLPTYICKYATQQLSQFLDCPTNIHMQAAHRILRYIKAAPGQGIFFSAKSSSLQLKGWGFFSAKSSLQRKGFTNSNWDACSDTKRSVTLEVSWKSKKQVTISRSSSDTPLIQSHLTGILEIQKASHNLKEFLYTEL
ncbi:PREDICTED: uncharacterized protein LOC109192828 [Ipomoea nil]|uniref:uncharacterized protein LOC109192828 n=1 Tax=Ipomoea nil TaxID=35883 RepID=UPI000901C70E|nr:PREDICTED: uncharacterized protein LOC109192828 [Ipomoea nil]